MNKNYCRNLDDCQEDHCRCWDEEQGGSNLLPKKKDSGDKWWWTVLGVLLGLFAINILVGLL